MLFTIPWHVDYITYTIWTTPYCMRVFRGVFCHSKCRGKCIVYVSSITEYLITHVHKCLVISSCKG